MIRCLTLILLRDAQLKKLRLVRYPKLRNAVIANLKFLEDDLKLDIENLS